MIQQGMIEVAALEEEVVGANTNKSHTIPWTRTMRVLTLTWMCKTPQRSLRNICDLYLYGWFEQASFSKTKHGVRNSY